jgi:capsid protein
MQIDPSKAADASEKRMRLGLSTLAEETIALSGKSWEENLAQRAQEKEAHEALDVPYLQSQNAPQAQPGQNPAQDPNKDPQDPEDPNEGDEE